MNNKALYDARWRLLAAITEYKTASPLASVDHFLRIQSCIEELVHAVETYTVQGELK